MDEGDLLGMVGWQVCGGCMKKGERVNRAVIQVKVVPRSSRDQIVGVEAGVARIKLKAPAVEGRANEALRFFLAKRLGVSKEAVEVVKGKRSRIKTLRVHGCSQTEATQVLLGPAPSGPGADTP